MLIVAILLVHVVAIPLGLYDNDSPFDTPMHFMGGFAIAYLALAAWNASIQKISFQKDLNPRWHIVIYALGILRCVALVGVVWEWYEFVLDTLIVKYGYGERVAQMGLGDTMLDLFLDLLGAFTAFILFRRRDG